jgi:DNA modification methylase
MNGRKADVVFTDPPYNVGGESRNFAADVSKSMRAIADAPWDQDFDVRSMLSTVKHFSAEWATIYICTSHFLFGEIYAGLRDWATFVSYCVWNKPNPMPSLSKRHWTWNSELIVYATRSGHVFNFPNVGHAYSVWTINKCSDGTHPTQKPIELVVYALSHSSDTDAIVFDPFLGSGTTLIAAHRQSRTCYGIEIEPKYCDVILKRAEAEGLSVERADGKAA